MKKFLLSSVALLGFTAGAMAADLPRRAPPAFVPIPVFTWTGFYVGVNAGYAWNNNDDDCGAFGGFGCGGGLTVDTPAFLIGSTAPVVPVGGGFFGFGDNGNNGRDGFTGGAQIGFNYQFTPGAGFVIGFEADIQWLGSDDNNNGFFGGSSLFQAVPTAAVTQGIGSGIALGTGAPGIGANNVFLFGNGFGNNRGNENDWWATARVRVGYAFDRTLIYATGGVAFTDSNNDKCDGFGGCGFVGAPALGFFTPAGLAAAAVVAPVAFSRRDNNNVGWVLGAGVEYAFTNNLTVKLEGLWINLDRDNNDNFGNNIVGVSNNGAPIRSSFVGSRNDEDEWFVARIGVNYKFGL
jgi:outer membrane immunogenic protein